MRRISQVWSMPFAALAASFAAVACGAAQDTKPATPATAATPAPAPTAEVPAPAAHAPAPALPPGIESASIDTSVAPCDDFFQYACGGWVKSHPIPEDQAGWGRFNVLAEQNELALKDILEQDRTKPGTEPYSKALGDFYDSCIDEAKVEKDGLKAIEPTLKEIQGVKDAAGLARAMAKMHLMGVYPFFNLSPEQDFKDATQMIAAIDQAGLGLPDRDYYLKDDAKMATMRDAYVAHAERVFGLLGDKPEVAKQEAQALFTFEKSLAEPQMARVDKRDPNKIYHRMDRAELAKTAPGFAWDAYFKEMGFPGITAINVYEPTYLAAVDKKLAGATKATWENELRPYLRFHLATGFAKVLPKRFVDEAFSFEKQLTGAEKLPPRWKQCVRAVDRGMGEALAIPFVKAKLGAEGKQATSNAIADIETAMLADLAKVTWMDDATRAKAIEKVHKIANKIGYPDVWRKYDTLKVDRASYAANAARSSTVETKRQLARIGKPVDRNEWGLTPPTVNAYYNPSLNEMVFPAGILQTPFYTQGAPVAVNFGGIGMVMGHELTHGFDDEGRQFDGSGNLTDWWGPKVVTEFEHRASCVADQFDGYVAVDDLHLNGKLTLGENIADLGGIKLALTALHSKGQATPEQDRQFFLGYAQSWCQSQRPELSRVRVRVDPHSPPKFRVNGPLSNTPDFAAAFSCQAGDAMVRAGDKACTVW
ncbi:MAG TPA: M13 family metallopeptidase [Polyangiaceae bacterium]|jgi:endothelin-converting enzyme/putative endopeptidase